MEKFMQGVNRFIRDEEGVTAIEYGLIAALIAVVIIASVRLVGTELVAVFTAISGELATATP
jgi:pilus assembly protein Flp/PilA